VARVRDDHESIRVDATALADPHEPDDAVASARALGERLAAHVRFEERVAFEILERRLTATELERLGHSVAEAEGQRASRSHRR
jgi:hypothetical protein